MSRRYDAEFSVRVELEVADEVIERTGREDWQALMGEYGEEDLVEMLARCLGLDGMQLSQLDGFADLADSAARVRVHRQFEDWMVR